MTEHDDELGSRLTDYLQGYATYSRPAPVKRRARHWPEALAAGLADAGFDAGSAAFFGWLGVVPYLTLNAFRATLAAIAQLPAASAVSFDYAIAPETLSPLGRKAHDALAGRVAAAGEPFQLFFTPQQMESELRRAGFRRVEQVDSARLNELYFNNRADGLKLSALGLGMLATAWV